MLQLKSAEVTFVIPWCPISGLTGGTWVKLLEPISEFSDDEALLLCPASDNHWLAWIPDYGEAILDKYQFYTFN